LKKIKLAIDWTPNINHIGFFVSLEKNFYGESGIDIQIINPFDDNYSITPAKKIELNIAEFALCPTETLISYNTKKNKVNLLGIAAILKEDLSAIVVNRNSNIYSPKDLDGKTYASFNARYEEHIIKQMVINDGGEGKVNYQYPDKLGIWDTIINSKFDSTWIFKNWEGVEAENLNVKFNYFSMKDYGIPYSYSPILVCNKNNLSLEPYIISFIESTRKGFTYALNNKEDSIEILKKYLPSKEKNINLNRAFELTIPSMSIDHDWGKFDLKKVQLFLDWLYKFKIENKVSKAKEIFTNEYLF
tara:strand:- start:1115 stop:2020 length:906 start_codon:yes stop_codon:yes gene_type:complete